jgi:hypothetical protein
MRSSTTPWGGISPQAFAGGNVTADLSPGFFGPGGPVFGASQWLRQQLGIDPTPASSAITNNLVRSIFGGNRFGGDTFASMPASISSMSIPQAQPQSSYGGGGYGGYSGGMTAPGGPGYSMTSQAPPSQPSVTPSWGMGGGGGDAGGWGSLGSAPGGPGGFGSGGGGFADPASMAAAYGVFSQDPQQQQQQGYGYGGGYY